MNDINITILERCAKELNKLKVPNLLDISEHDLTEIRKTKHNVATLISQIVKEEKIKMMTERIEPKKIYMYAVVPYVEWNEYSPTYEYDETDFDYWADGDYQVFGIVVDDQLIFLDDNMHNHPNDFLEGVCCALEKFFNVHLIHDVLYLDEDVYAYDKTKVQEAIYKKWKSEN